ncbi:murein hydrolase activator EnvC family protein [Dankookia sp. P2]|uniref:murein hydrolase activator EnvC family protein n=1 Tax=Dankookia sp. P2 TaxID=3423955 RepID=UPI003D674676
MVSPCGGKVVFGSSFRSYGLLLIVDCGDGYHFVLAGLDRLDASPGQRVLAEEPVGQLGAAEKGGRAPLYLELRRNGQPVDPRDWFTAKG